MVWPEIRKGYPDQWVVVEALKAHTNPDLQWKLDIIAVIETYQDSSAAMSRYRHWQRQYPDREFFMVYTSREELNIWERLWVGIRTS